MFIYNADTAYGLYTHSSRFHLQLTGCSWHKCSDKIEKTVTWISLIQDPRIFSTY